MQRSENFSLGPQGTTNLSREDSHAKQYTAGKIKPVL